MLSVAVWADFLGCCVGGYLRLQRIVHQAFDFAFLEVVIDHVGLYTASHDPIDFGHVMNFLSCNRLDSLVCSHQAVAPLHYFAKHA